MTEKELLRTEISEDLMNSFVDGFAILIPKGNKDEVVKFIESVFPELLRLHGNPIVSQWKFEQMVHEAILIRNNR